MIIQRVTNPLIIKTLYPLFIEDGGFTRDIVAKELFQIMITSPNEIYVATIIEKDEILGFAVAWVQEDREFVWLAQAWSKPETDRRYGKEAIKMIQQWALKEHNLHEMRFETDRNPKAIERAWGFKFHATVMNCKF